MSQITPWQARTALHFARAHSHGWASLCDVPDEDVIAWLVAGEIDRIREAVVAETPDWPGITPAVAHDSDGDPYMVHTTQTGRVSWEVWGGCAFVSVFRPGVEGASLRITIDDEGAEWELAEGAQIAQRHLNAVSFVPGPTPQHILDHVFEGEAAEAREWERRALDLLSEGYTGPGPRWAAARAAVAAAAADVARSCGGA